MTKDTRFSPGDIVQAARYNSKDNTYILRRGVVDVDWEGDLSISNVGPITSEWSGSSTLEELGYTLTRVPSVDPLEVPDQFGDKPSSYRPVRRTRLDVFRDLVAYKIASFALTYIATEWYEKMISGLILHGKSAVMRNDK